MPCPCCGVRNDDDDHRCLHCGRLLPHVVTAAPASYVGAAAASPQPDTERLAADPLAPTKLLPAAAARKPAMSLRAYLKRFGHLAGGEFPATGHVAPPVRRVAAAAIDIVMVLLGFSVFAGAAWFAGSAFGAGKVLGITLAVSLALLSLLYGLIWAVAMRETAGMNWMQLELVTFDGSPVDRRSRAIRFISAWLSYCSGGIVLLWALGDAERLTFHDRASQTYPADKSSPRDLISQRT